MNPTPDPTAADLASHCRALSRRTLAELFAADPGALRAAVVCLGRLARRSVEGAPRSGYAAAARRTRGSDRLARVDRGALRRRKGQPVRAPPRAAHGAAAAGRRAAPRRRPRCHRRDSRGASADENAHRANPRRSSRRCDRPSHPLDRQPGHRWLGPRPAPRLHGACAAARRAPPIRTLHVRRRRLVRRQCRSGAPDARARTARSRDHALHRRRRNRSRRRRRLPTRRARRHGSLRVWGRLRASTPTSSR